MQVTAQTEISITLKWEKVQNNSTYILWYGHNGSIKDDINNTVEAWVTHEVSGLTPGTKYNFTIITKFEGSESPGYTVEAVTSKRDWKALKIFSLSKQRFYLLVILIVGPVNPEELKAITQTETNITLQWSKVNDIRSYVLVYNEINVNVSASDADKVITDIFNLTSSTRYIFRVFAVFENIRSSGISFSAATGNVLNFF